MRGFSLRSSVLVAGCTLLVATVSLSSQPADAPPGAQPRRPDTAPIHHWLGVEHHHRRSLNQASAEYAKALALDPPRDLTAEQQRLVRRFAPRLYTTPNEPFALEDFAVIVHPDRRLIAYHLFWDDDIDFPEDNDPCDHEVVWVQYAADAQQIEQVWTYFHGQLLNGGEAAVKEARAHGQRPRINVQWGKHGSLPAGWDAIAAVKQHNEETWRTLSKGRRLATNAIGARLGWPERFSGTWDQFVDFSKVVDPIALLDKNKMAKVSRWNSATINQQFLAYNFRPKTEWPPDAAMQPPFKSDATTSLDTFQLPPKAIFDAAMPRYPNLWLYLDASLVESYDAAVSLMTGALKQTMGLHESYGPFSNPEACDYEGGMEHLQPWLTREMRAQQHGHAFHIRYYGRVLERQKLERVTLDTAAGKREFYRLPTSAHYEVEHFNPSHADVELCPICGRTGDYAAVKGSLVEMVHDPLGVELAVSGTIRGERVKVEDDDQRELRGVAALDRQFSTQSFVFPAKLPEQNTLRVGVVVITPSHGS